MSLRRPGSLRWFVPGLHIKRWLLLLGISVAIIALGGAYALRSLYEKGARLPGFFRYVTLAFLPGPLRALLFAVIQGPTSGWGNRWVVGGFILAAVSRFQLRQR